MHFIPIINGRNRTVESVIAGISMENKRITPLYISK